MQVRLTQVAAKYGEVAPQAAVCCNACRTCVQTNLLTAALAVAAALSSRLLGRTGRGSSSSPAAKAPSAP